MGEWRKERCNSVSIIWTNVYIFRLLWNATWNIVYIYLVGFYLQEINHLILFQQSDGFQMETSNMICKVRGKSKILYQLSLHFRFNSIWNSGVG